MSSVIDSTAHEIAAIWADVLQLSRLPAPEDNFFSLGGDSLLMTMVLFRVNEAFHIELPPVALLDAPELGAFGSFVAGVRRAEGQGSDGSTL